MTPRDRNQLRKVGRSPEGPPSFEDTSVGFMSGCQYMLSLSSTLIEGSNWLQLRRLASYGNSQIGFRFR
jgi:hypothetical protein